jgi:hypothetical protein
MNITITNLRKLYNTDTNFEVSIYKDGVSTPLLDVKWDRTISFRRNKKILTRLLLTRLYQHLIATDQLEEFVAEIRKASKGRKYAV